MGRLYKFVVEQVQVSAAQDLFQIKNISSSKASSISSIAAAGSNYSVGDLIYLSGGIFTKQCILKVATLSGSGVASATIFSGGSYSTTPSNAVAQMSTSGSGSGATFNLTWATVSKVLFVRKLLWKPTDNTLATAQILATRGRILSPTVTDGSGGITISPVNPVDLGDTESTFTVLANNTTPATTTGPIRTFHEGGEHIYSGEIVTYSLLKEAPPILVGESATYELLSAPQGSPHISIKGWVEECGG